MTAQTFSDALGEISEKYIMEAISYRRKHRRINHSWLKWVAMAACLCLVVATGIIVPKLINPVPVEIASQGALAGAPMIYVNDTLYRQSTDETSYAELSEEFIYLGEIKSEVISDQSISDGIPNKNFQANHAIAGSKVYQYGNNIVVGINGRYWLYENWTGRE